MKGYISICCAVMVFAFAALPAEAQSRKELDQRLQVAEQALRNLEQRFLTGDPAAERLLQRIDALESTNRLLTGQLEQMQFERDAMAIDVNDLKAENADLIMQLNEIRDELDAVRVELGNLQINGVAAQSYESYSDTFSDSAVTRDGDADPYVADTPYTSEPVALAEGNADVDMSEMLGMALQKVDEGDFTSARMTLEQYVALDPGAGSAGEAYYYLGETYYVDGKYADAAESFIASLENDPSGPFAPEAMVRFAAALNELGDKDQACKVLDQFPKQFPNVTLDLQARADLEGRRAGCVAG